MTVESDSSPAVCGGAWPPGFRFHPTDEELVLYYLKRKICRKKLKLNFIAELDVYKWDPEELPGLSLLRTGDRQWYFFSTRDRRYPNGARSNRATGQGYWKATGKDRNITSNSRSVGVKKTLVFYRGRAPSGLRTDWVMHEYTLDEDEYRRCQNVKDYYALYKVYKKSGAGPKNGEQYGAPFREEEWADDDGDVAKATEHEIQSRQLPVVTCIDDASDNGHFQLPLDDLEELLNECFVPELDQSPSYSAGPHPTASVCVNEEMKSSLISPSASNVFCETVDVCNSTQLDDLLATVDWANLGTTQIQQNEASEVTHAPQNYTFEAQGSGDYLEINDLLGPVPAVGGVDKPVDQLSFEEVVGLSGLDLCNDVLYHDAAMFLRDIGPLDQGINETNVFYYGVEQQQQQPNLVASDPNINQLWALDQRTDALSWAESVQAPQPHPHPSGLSSDPSSVLNDGTQNQSGMEAGGGRMSQFSSAVWSFVESIPTNPAAASENALVNRALERMSSFSRVRVVNSMSANVGAVAAVRRRKSRGFVLVFYVVGVLGALFGVLIGYLRLWQRFVSA